MPHNGDFITAKDFNKITHDLERNGLQFNPKFADDEHFLDTEAIELGMQFELENTLANFLMEEFQDLYAQGVLTTSGQRKVNIIKKKSDDYLEDISQGQSSLDALDTLDTLDEDELYLRDFYLQNDSLV